MPFKKGETESTNSGITNQSSKSRIPGTRLCHGCSRKCYRRDLSNEMLREIMMIEAEADNIPDIKPEIKKEKIDRLNPEVKKEKIDRLNPEVKKENIDRLKQEVNEERIHRLKSEVQEKSVDRSHPPIKEENIGRFKLEVTPQDVSQPTRQTTKRRTTFKKGDDVSLKKLVKPKSSRASSKTTHGSVVDQARFIEIDNNLEATKQEVGELNMKPDQTGKKEDVEDLTQVKDNKWDWFTSKINPWKDGTDNNQVEDGRKQQDKLGKDEVEAKSNVDRLAHRHLKKDGKTESQVIEQKKELDANPVIKQKSDEDDQNKSHVLSDEHKLLLLKGFVINEIAKELLTIMAKQKDADKNRLSRELHTKVKSEFTNLEKQFCKLIRKSNVLTSNQQNTYCLSINDLSNISDKVQRDIIENAVSYLTLVTQEMAAKKKSDSEEMAKKYLKAAACDSSVRLSQQFKDSKENGVAKVMSQICKQMETV